MESIRKLISYGTGLLCWVVKGAGLALLLLVAVIFIGEGPPNPFKLSFRELVLMISLLVSLAGMVLAFWRQLIGGIAIVVGMIPFLGESHQWVFYVFILIGVLNIFCWLVKRSQKSTVS
jgi:hypothetical protein